jgi:hypothetical protein
MEEVGPWEKSVSWKEVRTPREGGSGSWKKAGKWEWR